MRRFAAEKIIEALKSVLPVAALVVLLSVTGVAPLGSYELLNFALSTVFLIIGIALFNLGADLAMTPMGEHAGEGLTKSGKPWLLFAVSFLTGVLITVAEPDLTVLANQVSTAINPLLLIVTVGAGVGLFLVIAVARIFARQDILPLLLFFYFGLFALATLLLEKGNGVYLPMAFDSGGVTTGPVTVPYIMALGVGIALTVGGKNADENSFGLVSLCSIGPVLAVLILCIGIRSDLSYALPDYSVPDSFTGGFLRNLPHVTSEVGRALLLIVLFFTILQFTVLRLPRVKLLRIGVGIAYTFVGLVLFLTSVNIGYMPTGFIIGRSLAEGKDAVLVTVAAVIGMLTVLAEPAVHVLTRQVESLTSGGVTRLQMLIALSAGVGISLGLSVIRIMAGFSILYYLIPGYLISLALSFFVPRIYTAIAFDSGGVASGPLTSGFILPLAIGACSVLQGADSVLSLAFGVVSMVAMTPLITIQTLGFRAVVGKIIRERSAMKRILSADDEQIIYFE